VYVEEVNPANPNEVRFNGRWEPLKVVREEIKAKGDAPRTAELKFSRHGPIFFEDESNHRAYALRSALNEPGTAPYLAGLRLSQAQNCKDLLEAAMYWTAPSENLICGDVDGNISWQASALTPNRKGWVGRLPVPGTGKYEWQGFRADLPRELNPERGFVATANHNIHPAGYMPPIMFKRPSDVDRIDRLLQVLKPGQKYTVGDHKRLQHDELSLQAKADVPLFQGWTGANAEVERARQMVASWEGVLSKASTPAAIYQEWRAALDPRVRNRDLTADERQNLMETALQAAVTELTMEQGADWAEWRWGRSNARSFPHPVLEAFDVPTVERGGGGGTVAANGASYRQIFDVSNWDRSLVVNVPGQSGQPESPYYSNLLQLWTNNEYFPLAFTRGAVEKVASHRLTLQPGRAPTQ
jgi:penicillin amidase